jgi:peptidoglycan-N-acetylglucosamine deacetylase
MDAIAAPSRSRASRPALINLLGTKMRNVTAAATRRIFFIVALLCVSLALLGFGLLELINARSFQLFGGLVQRVDTAEKVVALTFDDGPTQRTESILAILEEADIKATFFLEGKTIAENMEEAQRIVDAGHELGNHTFSHQRMVFKSPAFVREEIESTDQLIQRAGYEGDIHFRPPYGKKLFFLPYYLNRHGRTTIMWNIEPDSYPDIAADSQNIIRHVQENIVPGSIILLHVMFDNDANDSLASISGIVTALNELGYSFKTVSELLEYQQ